MIMAYPLTAHEKFAREQLALLNRWIEESDIDDMEMAQIAASVINKWLDDEFMVFEPEEDG